MIKMSSRRRGCSVSSRFRQRTSPADSRSTSAATATTSSGLELWFPSCTTGRNQRPAPAIGTDRLVAAEQVLERGDLGPFRVGALERLVELAGIAQQDHSTGALGDRQ